MWKKIWYILGTAGLFYLAVLYNSRALLIVCIMAILLPVFFLSVLFQIKQKLKPELLFFSYPQADTGDYLVGMRVENPTNIYLPRVRVKLKVTNMASGKKHWVKLSGKIPAGTVTDLKGKLKNPKFGLWEAECEKLYCYEWMNLLYLPRNISEKKQVLIFPDAHQIHLKIGIRTRMFLSDGEQYHPHARGDDPSETLKLREYQKGDRLNRIHWKLSVKNSSLIVAELSMPLGCNVVFFLDAEPSRMKEKEARSYWEVVNTISQELMAQECPHYLVWQDKAQDRLCRMAVRRMEDIADFWREISVSELAKGAEPEAYGRAFAGDSYASSLVWNEKLELFCNQQLLAQFRPGQVRRQLMELELLL